MANEEQLSILKQGVEVWNGWREENLDVEIDLSKADLTEANLRYANLSRAVLSGADLAEAKVTEKQLATAKSLKGATMPDGKKHN